LKRRCVIATSPRLAQILDTLEAPFSWRVLDATLDDDASARRDPDPLESGAARAL